MEISFGVLSPPLEEQVNKQGYTLGDKGEYFDKVSDAYLTLRLGGFLSDSQCDSICKKITRRLAKSCQKLEKESDNQ